MKFRAFLLAAAFAALSAAPAQAIVFDLFWSGDPALDPQLLEASDPTATLSGTIEIDAGPGARFVSSDIVASDIFLSGDNFESI